MRAVVPVTLPDEVGPVPMTLMLHLRDGRVLSKDLLLALSSSSRGDVSGPALEQRAVSGGVDTMAAPPATAPTSKPFTLDKRLLIGTIPAVLAALLLVAGFVGFQARKNNISLASIAPMDGHAPDGTEVRRSERYWCSPTGI